jgi:hypothetical protein
MLYPIILSKRNGLEELHQSQYMKRFKKPVHPTLLHLFY